MTRIFKGQGYTLEYFGPEEYADKVGWKTAGSAGFDLCCLDELERPSFAHSTSVSTGMRIIECDPQLVGLVFLRSSAASKHGLRMTNSVAVIDSDYRGEIRILLQNYPPPALIGSPIAQLVFVPFAGALVAPEAKRAGGFGSTDK